MSIFNGVTGLFEGIFDSEVTLHRAGQADFPCRGIFREEPTELNELDGSDTIAITPTLKLRAVDAARVTRGDSVSVSERPGEIFRVTAKYPTRSPANDRHFFITLTEDDIA
jgi:hypothetical protein